MKPEGMSEERIKEIEATCQSHIIQELVAEVRRLRGALKVVGDEGLEINGRLLTENEALASKLAVATEALRWYAEPKSWCATWDPELEATVVEDSAAAADRGARAREALKTQEAQRINVELRAEGRNGSEPIE